ncbi:hypothetical protein CASFOL_041940 [Castilleja foliolosa]|uniref:Uncharacterized protein n=1 Tax=Castilleja foliolosa TaxID=1961234 RepID=A0ABD3B932_9LAMI
MSFQSPMKEKASNLKSEMDDDKAFGSVLDGEGIGPLSLTKPDSISQLSSAEEVSNDVDEELQAEELGSDVDEELPVFDFGEDIPFDCLPLVTFEVLEMDLAGFAMAPHMEEHYVPFNIIAP